MVIIHFLLILSSDHFIEDKSKFINTIEFGKKYAKLDRLVTFGVIPDSPETGYGYIESKRNSRGIKVSNIKKFIEKPDLIRQKNYN